MAHSRIALLGAGAVAHGLGPRLEAAGYDLRCWARDPERAAGVAPYLPLEQVGALDLAWIVVSDRAIGEVAQALADAGPPPVVLHASGFHGVEVLAPLEPAARGALHPLISFPGDTRPDPRGASFALAGDAAAQAAGAELVAALGGHVLDLAESPAARAAYHAAAALTANGLVALLDQALETLAPHLGRREAGRALTHLGRGVLEHLAEGDTAAALTGPVARGDAAVVAGHLRVLPDDAAAVYRLLVGRMLTLADLEPAQAAAIRALLDG